MLLYLLPPDAMMRLIFKDILKNQKHFIIYSEMLIKKAKYGGI